MKSSSNWSSRSSKILAQPLSSSATNRRYSFLEYLTMVSILDCVSSLYYLAGPISEAIKVGFGQLNAITGGSLSEVL